MTSFHALPCKFQNHACCFPSVKKITCCGVEIYPVNFMSVAKFTGRSPNIFKRADSRIFLGKNMWWFISES